jgi:hypothetical protein
METDGLRLRIWLDSDSTCELEACVRAGFFSGLGSAWFDVTQLTEFADGLSTFPLGNVAAEGIASGYGDPLRAGELSETHLKISVRQYDSAGHIGVRVFVATPANLAPRPGSPHIADVAFCTTYAQLDRFVPEFRALLAGRATEAILVADG